MKKLFSLLLAAALTFSLTACGGGETSEAENNVLVLGGSGPLTGIYASYGISVRNGAQLAVNELNEKGGVDGVTFKLAFQDDQADPAMAVNVYNQNMDDGMMVSLSATTSGCSVAVGEESKKDGILTVVPSGSQVECAQYDNAFRVCFTDPALGTYAADFMADHDMAEKIAILYDKSLDYSVGVTNKFLEQAKARGLNVVTMQAYTNQSNIDFSVQLAAVKDSGADLLFLPVYAQEAAYILTQAEKMDFDGVTLFGCDGLDGIVEKIGKENYSAIEDVLLLTPFMSNSSEENVKHFTDAYKAAYEGAVPDQFAADAYDAVYVVAEALKKSGVNGLSDPEFNEKMIAVMTEIEVNGVTGTMTWTPEGEALKQPMAVVIKNGQYEEYKQNN